MVASAPIHVEVAEVLELSPIVTPKVTRPGLPGLPQKHTYVCDFYGINLERSAAPICRLLLTGSNKSNQSVPASDSESRWGIISENVFASRQLLSFSLYLFPSPGLCGPYQDHPSWQISTWKRLRYSGELSDSSLCSPTDLFLPAVEKLKSKGRSVQPTKAPLQAPERGKKGGSMLSSTLAAYLTDGVNSRSRQRQNSSSGNNLQETQRHSPLVFNDGQDRGGGLREDANGEPSGHPADG